MAVDKKAGAELIQKISTKLQGQTRSHVLGWVAVVALTVIGLIALMMHNERYPSTNDAYVGANISQISSQVSGRVDKLNIKNNQTVQKGDVLFVLDQRPFVAALDQAEANLQSARSSVAAQEPVVANTETQARRAKTLLSSSNISIADRDNAVTVFKVAKSQLDALLNQQAQAQAQVNLAKLHLEYATVRAPASGQIVNLTMRPHDSVEAGQPLFSLIDNDQWWVDANYKETQLGNIKPGQTARIVLDMKTSHDLQGVVDSVSGGSGAAFALLPPENATGNWIKVTQRVPVRVLITTLPQMPLKVGLTATVTVDTHS